MTNSKILRGLEIIGKHLKKDDYDIHPEHDILYAGDYERLRKKLTEEEFEELLALGWFKSDDSWACFA